MAALVAPFFSALAEGAKGGGALIELLTDVMLMGGIQDWLCDCAFGGIGTCFCVRVCNAMQGNCKNSQRLLVDKAHFVI